MGESWSVDSKYLSAPIANHSPDKPAGRFALPKAMLRLLWWSLIMAVIPRLCLIGFNFAQQFLITAALRLFSEPVNPNSRNEGYGLIGATALIYLGIAVSHSNPIVPPI